MVHVPQHLLGNVKCLGSSNLQDTAVAYTPATQLQNVAYIFGEQSLGHGNSPNAGLDSQTERSDDDPGLIEFFNYE